MKELPGGGDAHRRPVKKAAPKKAAAKKAAPKKAAKKVPGKKAAAKKVAKKAAPAKKVPGKKAAKKAAPAKKAPGKKAAKKAASGQSGTSARRPALPAAPTDPLVILGVREPFSMAQLRRAWRLYAATHHPDSGGDSAMFSRGREAYLTLRSRAQ
ncbi:hypothetical protein [Mycolicibacterium fluoranthenivorans]|uniref:Outer membrane biosynthesis protein TonB n=1 Tax=Mycolicibacterium fluoranthenivorans TaxID=258505 RepID=A0A7X5U621_9MYCO|nr:hypothetical protein [Mycolicibacterium fluoranthenivorans]MCV7356528.1 hypothetical protein [Mycolicibacterium fluoranthenivorans]NIH99082.1 outer membrane biosynthesis protein TonB [Mycolicibacterium fluoranthenivorans]